MSATGKPLDWPAPGGSARGVIDGAAGAIECLIARPKAAERGVAVVCHPHPLHGGAMSNKVVYTLSSCALQAGLAVARFNFRGVGASGGQHDNTRGETEDCVRVVDWMRRQKVPDDLLLAGFSFGAYVSLKAASRTGARVLVSVAPPFGRYLEIAEDPPHPGCPWLVLHSRDDDIVAYDDTAAAAARYQPPPQWVAVDGAGHLFHGRLADVQEAVVPFLQSAWPLDPVQR